MDTTSETVPEWTTSYRGVHADLATQFGPFGCVWTDGARAACMAGTYDNPAHLNDERPGFNYRGERYIGYLHLHSLDGSPCPIKRWTSAPECGITEPHYHEWDVKFTRNAPPPKYMHEAPRTYALAMADAILNRVKAAIATSDVLHLARHTWLVRELNIAMGQAQTKREELREADKEVSRLSAELDACGVPLMIAPRS